MSGPFTEDAKLLLGHIFYRVKASLLKAMEDGDVFYMPSDNEIADTLTQLVAAGHLDPVALEDEALDRLT